MNTEESTTHRIHLLQYGTGVAPRWLYFHLDETPGGVPVGMYCWLIEGPSGWVLVDVGATEEDTRARYGDRYSFADWLDPVDLVAEQVSPEDVGTVVFTHAHWDHLSPCADRYPSARFVVQRREIEARVNPPHPTFRELCFADYIDGLGERFGSRLELIDGDCEIVPGIRTIVVGGHTLGSQAVLVETARGTACIAGDLVPSYENLETDHATALHEDLLACYAGMARIREHSDFVIPGHDRRVLERHPHRVVG